MDDVSHSQHSSLHRVQNEAHKEFSIDCEGPLHIKYKMVAVFSINYYYGYNAPGLPSSLGS